MKIADLGVSNEFDGADALLTNTAGTPAFTGEQQFNSPETIYREIILVLTDVFVSAPECLSIKNGDSPYSGKVSIVKFQIQSSILTHDT